MAFIIVGGNVISFAEYSDVTNTDQRLFEANEGLSESIVEDHLVRATERILLMIQQTDWWKTYYIRQSGGNLNPDIYTTNQIYVPAPEANKIQARQNDFTDLCVYYALSQLIYPKIADFSVQDSAEQKKIGLFDQKFRQRFQEILDDGAWYDFNGTGSVTPAERMPVKTNLVRIR
ncbi:MAG: hypothetical protein RJA42_298 [Bacteroidota bacterium]|jgi:predicted nucleotidyltransferase